MMTSSLPNELGYRWPAEWEPHAATWLAWPHKRDTWPEMFDRIPPIFARIIEAIACYEQVNLLVSNDDSRGQAEAMIGTLPNVTLHSIATSDAWIRDCGPTFLLHESDVSPALIDWQYNAWGGKYPPWDDDNRVPSHIADAVSARRFASDFVLEGGAIDGNGAGTAVATESCLLNANRNPSATIESVECLLRDYLGVRKVLWLDGGGVPGDDTDGHVDQIVRFVDRTTVVCAVARDSSHEGHDLLLENYERLQTMTTADGDPLSVVPLFLPDPKFRKNHPLPASYCNFYVANGVVIVPTFNDDADEAAKSMFAELFPDRDVVPIDSIDLVWGLGAIHCLTQQQPRAATTT